VTKSYLNNLCHNLVIVRFVSFLCQHFQTGSTYKTCCGKVICSGCIHAPVYDNQGNKIHDKKCPFCRVLAPTSDEEIIERLNKRKEAEDPIAIYNKGVYYRDGVSGFTLDHVKSLELFQRAGELGFAAAFCKIGNTILAHSQFFVHKMC